VPAIDLCDGEHLITRNGSIGTVRIERKAGTFQVYNLEVEADHCFYVSDAEVLTHNNSCVKYTKDANGLTIEAEAVIDGSHPGRRKGYRPEPAGGRAKGDHRGHLIPEGGVDNPSLVNVRENIIAEAGGSNLGPKKVFENKAISMADDNPNSVVKTIHRPLRKPGEVRPFAVTHLIEMDGVIVHGVSIFNR
jgi:hypothetical protein